MPPRFWHPAEECAPLPDLVTALQARLASTDVFIRAAASPLYCRRWQAAGVDPAAIRTYADLQRIPYTQAAHLRVAQQEHHPNEFAVSTAPPRVWVSTSGSTGVPKWIPISAKDIASDMDVGYRFAYTPSRLPEPGDVNLSVTAPAPFLSEVYLWLGSVDRLLGGGPQDVRNAENIVFSFEAGQEGVAMAFKRKANCLVAFPSLAMKIAEGLSEALPAIARDEYQKKKSLANFIAVLATRRGRTRARKVLPIRTGYFGGEPLAPYRAALLDAWGMQETYNLYTFSEYHVFSAECRAHAGLHAWVDISLLEMIPQSELDREHDEPGYIPLARPIWETSAGEEGELVLTNFGDAFPLVRWRTSDLIRVAGIEPCACGRTHPRVNFSQRSDDLVNLGIIRFSIFTLKEKLDAVTAPARIARWQLRVGRQGYKPRLTVLVRPETAVDLQQVEHAVREAVLSTGILRSGVESGLICEPVIRVDPQLGESLSSTGKFRPLVYESPAEGGKA